MGDPASSMNVNKVQRLTISPELIQSQVNGEVAHFTHLEQK